MQRIAAAEYARRANSPQPYGKETLFPGLSCGGGHKADMGRCVVRGVIFHLKLKVKLFFTLPPGFPTGFVGRP